MDEEYNRGMRRDKQKGSINVREQIITTKKRGN